MLLTDAVWAAIQALDGETIMTVGRGDAGRGHVFTVTRPTETQIVVAPERGEPRLIRRQTFADALALDVPADQLRPVMLKAVPSQRATASYVVAILRELHRRGML